MMGTALFQNTALLFCESSKQLSLPGMPQPNFKIGDKVGEKEYRGKYLGTIVGFVKSDENGEMLVKIKAVKSIAEFAGYSAPLSFETEEDSYRVCNEEPKGKYMYLFVPPSDLLCADKQSVAVQEMAEILYPDRYHRRYEIKPSPDDGFSQRRNPICWHEKCTQKSAGVGIINVWGTVLPVVMCHEHSHLHGMLFESNPFKRIRKDT
jgi:hypothetical protein